MKRRKPDSVCFNSYDYKRDDTVTPCNCTETDIECEFGYEWTGTDCVAVPHVEANQCSVRPPHLVSALQATRFRSMALLYSDLVRGMTPCLFLISRPCCTWK